MHSDLLTTDQSRAPVPGGEPGAQLSAVVMAESEVLRRGIDGLLRSLPEIDRVHLCAGPDALELLLKRECPDVVIVTAPEAGCLEQFREAFATAGTGVLLLVDQHSVLDMSKHPSPGNGGFLWQPGLTAAALRDAVIRCRGGEVAMPPDLLKALLARARGAGRLRGGAVNLTGREREALTLLVQGLSNKQIARRLSISSHGAKRLIASIMLKLDAPNRTLAAVMAIRAGLVNGE